MWGLSAADECIGGSGQGKVARFSYCGHGLTSSEGSLSSKVSKFFFLASTTSSYIINIIYISKGCNLVVKALKGYTQVVLMQVALVELPIVLSLKKYVDLRK